MVVKNRVVFKKPDFKSILKDDLTYVDMHSHTKYSDTYTKIPALLKKASKNGIGISITDHNEIKGSLEAFKNKGKVLIIPGTEISCSEGPHILLYFYSPDEMKEFYKKEIEKNRSPNAYTATKIGTQELLNKAKRYNCVVCAAHPFAPRYLNLYNHIKKKRIPKKILNDIDCFEVLSGLNTSKMTKKAIKWCSKLNYPFVGGSDSHTLSSLGAVLTYSEGADIESFLKNIIKKKNFVIGKETKFFSKASSFPKQIIKHYKSFENAKSSLKTQFQLQIGNYIKNENKK